MHPAFNNLVRFVSRLKVGTQSHSVMLSEAYMTSHKKLPVGAVFSAHYGTTRILSSSSFSESLPTLPSTSTQSKPVFAGGRPIRGDDPFITSVQEAKSAFEALQLIEDKIDKLEIPQIIWSFGELFHLLRNDSSKMSNKEVLNSLGMQKLNKALKKCCRNLVGGELITCLKLFVLLGPPSSEPSVQMLLKLLTKQANSLELSQIIYLHFLLIKMKEETKSPLSTALEYALPVVFESLLEKEAPHENLQALCDFLHYSSKNSLSERAFKILVQEILKKIEGLKPNQAMSVFWSIGDYKYDGDYLEPLVTVCYKHITESLHSFTMEELSTIISKAAKKYLKKVNYFYNEDFIQAYCNRLMTKNADPRHTLWSSKTVSIMRHVHLEYLDSIGDIIAKNPTAVLNDDFLFMSLVRCFSGSNYKPEKWSKFEALFLDHPALTKDLGLKDIPLALDLLSLGGFPEQLITKIYSPEELPRLDVFIQRNPFTTSATLALLYNTVKILYPSYSGPLPPLSMIEKWKQLVKHSYSKKVYLLTNALRTGFGGESYVINGVYHDGLHIDHAIVMRKGGFPIAMSSMSPQCDGLRDIRKPAESVIVLVKVFYKEAYANNTNRLRGLHALEQKVIEQLGHPMISIDAARWAELPDYEKIPFLMHRIREKIDKFQWNQSTSDVIPQ